MGLFAWLAWLVRGEREAPMYDGNASRDEEDDEEDEEDEDDEEAPEGF